MNFVADYTRPLALSFVLLSSTAGSFSPAWGMEPPQEDPTHFSTSLPAPQPMTQPLEEERSDTLDRGISLAGLNDILSYLSVEDVVHFAQTSQTYSSMGPKILYGKMCQFFQSTLNDDSTPALRALFDAITRDESDLSNKLSKVTDIYAPLSRGVDVDTYEDFMTNVFNLIQQASHFKHIQDTPTHVKKFTPVLRIIDLLPSIEGNLFYKYIEKEIDTKGPPHRAQDAAHIINLLTPDMKDSEKSDIILKALTVDTQDLPGRSQAISQSKEMLFTPDMKDSEKRGIIEAALTVDAKNLPEKAQAISQSKEMLFTPDMSGMDKNRIICAAITVDAKDLPGRAQAIAAHKENLFTSDMDCQAKSFVIITALTVNAQDLPGRAQAISEHKKKLFTSDMVDWNKSLIIRAALTVDTQDLPGRAQAISQSKEMLFTPNMKDSEKSGIIIEALKVDAKDLLARAEEIAQSKEMLFIQADKRWFKGQIIGVALRVDIEDVTARIITIENEISTFLKPDLEKPDLGVDSWNRFVFMDKMRTLALRLEPNKFEEKSHHIKTNMPAHLNPSQQREYIQNVLSQ